MPGPGAAGLIPHAPTAVLHQHRRIGDEYRFCRAAIDNRAEAEAFEGSVRIAGGSLGDTNGDIEDRVLPAIPALIIEPFNASMLNDPASDRAVVVKVAERPGCEQRLR